MSNDNFAPLLSGSTWGGASLSAVGAITLTQWLAVGGFVLALLGFVVNFWHKKQMIKIEKERLEREFPTDKSNLKNKITG